MRLICALLILIAAAPASGADTLRDDGEGRKAVYLLESRGCNAIASMMAMRTIVEDAGAGAYVKAWDAACGAAPAKADLDALDADPGYQAWITAEQAWRDRPASALTAVKSGVKSLLQETDAQTMARVGALDAAGVRQELGRIEVLLKHLIVVIAPDRAKAMEQTP